MCHCDNDCQRNGHQSISARDQAGVGHEQADFKTPDTEHITNAGDFVSIKKTNCKKTQKQ
jgi:hypothetical protein